MLAVRVGDPLVKLVGLAYEADQPVLLHGRHGVGKSETLAQAASSLGIGLVVCDLSLMEPPDLIGIPVVGGDGRTSYARPSYLPGGGRGLLVFEELNRCPRYMQSPCLQLLSYRRLHDYRLPPGWLPCAAVNDPGDVEAGHYAVDELDPAMLSRFLNVIVEPDAAEWARWARAHAVHERVIEFVEASPGVFDDPAANPRAWTHAGNLLSKWEGGERDMEVLAPALAGVLGDTWAAAFLETYRNERRPLKPDEIINEYPAHRAAFISNVRDGRLDLVAASVETLKRHIQPQPIYDSVVAELTHKGNVESFFGDLPAELRRQVSEWLSERGFDGLTVRVRPGRARA